MRHEEMQPDFSEIRQPRPHDSAVRHVTGEAVYVDDIREPSGTLHVVPGWADDAVRGTIAEIDLTAVRAAPGVVSVLTAADVSGANDVSPALGDEPMFATDEISFWGQPVFAVVAETREAARHAARLARIVTDALPPLLTIEDALEANETVLPDYQFRKGSPETGLATAERTLTGSLRIGGQEHFYLEGQVSLAVPGEEGDMFVHTSSQHPSETQHVVARVLGVPDAAVTVEVRRMGGGFGGKETQANHWASIAATAARVTGRPCKLRLDRDDDMIMTGKRHDMRVDWTVGHDAQGRIRVVDQRIHARCGYSADLSLGVVDRSMFHADSSYFYPDALIRSRRLKTHTCSNTAFRGFGGPQGMLAAERMMDALAITLGRDPLDLRKENFYGAGRDTTPYGMHVEEHDTLHALVAQLEESADYRARRAEITEANATSHILKRGLALTPVKFGIAFTLKHLNQAGALVHLYTDGSIHLNHGGTEMGQGLFQKVAQVVAEVFGVSLDRIRITATHTGKVPNTGPTAASSGTDLNAMAAKIAAETIRDRLIAFAVEHFDANADTISFRDNQVLIGNRSLSLGTLAKEAHLARVQLSSTGFYKTPDITWDRQSASGRPFHYFAFGAACSEVTIDTMTGEMRVDRVDILHDVGHSLNPAIDLGQIEGGFVQGMGWLTTEELVWDDSGRLRTHAPSTYKIPTASDVPEDLRVALYASSGNPSPTIHRSKAVGEPPLMLAISVFSAITDAISSINPGVVPELDAPATPEEILKAVARIKRTKATR
ncbi:xanthine dehydrogenase molybdopterin binding subunit [Stappia taiwanensis]|uniref:Xanthine dehydrogenase molybdopterin binding subunit n=1 Tax=Stappia taiwanensis TaxID=992267 RepID=A0A838Y2A7_9HYPH|nr:xanthine dehydrogenase molybdopterin binding subunit [Stappia taiwanensis]MBA4613143.1 xanthine dehydrogenase molybdopterin binding subunit [Stappia taiwanensis]GGE80167.1 xanthine dehydrogenase molybdopterin binding subunit [Stappia taiwanensis]